MNEDTKLVEDDSTPKTSLTRRKALGVGALAVGGAAALGSLVEASSAEAATVAGTTALKSAAAAGASTITVKSVSGLAVGYTIWIGTSTAGTPADSSVVKSVNAVTLKLGVLPPLAHAHPAGTRVSVLPPVTVAPGAFKDVMKKLVNDSAYCAAAVLSPGMITTDYPTLTPLELDAMREAAAVSGADISAINAARAAAIASGASGDKLVISFPPKGFSPACCSCCCCL